MSGWACLLTLFIWERGRWGLQKAALSLHCAVFRGKLRDLMSEAMSLGSSDQCVCLDRAVVQLLVS